MTASPISPVPPGPIGVEHLEDGALAGHDQLMMGGFVRDKAYVPATVLVRDGNTEYLGDQRALVLEDGLAGSADHLQLRRRMRRPCAWAWAASNATELA